MNDCVHLYFSPRCDGRIWAKDWSSVSRVCSRCQRIHSKAGMLCSGKVSSHPWRAGKCFFFSSTPVELYMKYLTANQTFYLCTLKWLKHDATVFKKKNQWIFSPTKVIFKKYWLLHGDADSNESCQTQIWKIEACTIRGIRPAALHGLWWCHCSNLCPQESLAK